MIWCLLGGFSSRIGDFLFSQEHSIRYHFSLSCSIQEMQITAFIPIVLVSCASMLKFTGVSQSTVISKNPIKTNRQFLKIFLENMYQDHGSSVNACRAVSLEPTQYIGHLRVSVWFFFPSQELIDVPVKHVTLVDQKESFYLPRGSQRFTEGEFRRTMILIVSHTSF